ncbi:zinc finger protein 93 [Amyelois transitella]|uniref:zinc finger protein 93 n=1 Tax=Amyelois transitella TaxID=680683 RepID=UPI00298FDEAC|nr:zinc finger protein 93 [Amyelois transitella]
MVTAYYMIQMAKNKTNTSIYEYYGDFLKYSTTIKDMHTKCRVCLKLGTVPIFEETSEISEALQCFGDIKVSQDDDLPKLLCETCSEFVKVAILFKNSAKRSDEILRKSIKEEQRDSDHDYDDKNISFETKISEDLPNKELEASDDTKTSKKKVKAAVKVTCHICSKVINQSYYKEHITMHDPNHKKYVCDICGKSFRLRCAYHNHSLRHSEDFPYKCNMCPYKGRYKELLKTHMKTHTGDYRYMCTECPARFLFKSNLNSHMLKHKEPQFKCDSCKRAFRTKLLLERHFEADHLGIKSHLCNICGKAFGYRNAMMKHQRHVHKREKFLNGRMPAYLVAQNEDGITK